RAWPCGPPRRMRSTWTWMDSWEVRKGPDQAVLKVRDTSAPAGPVVSPAPTGRRLTRVTSVDDREDVARGEDQVLLALVLDLGAAVLRVDDLVPLLDVHGDTVAVLVEAALADRDDGALLGLLLGGVRDDEAGRRGGLGSGGLDENLVLKRLDRH